jgi:hypothetical protein
MRKVFVMASALGVAFLLAWSATGQPPGGGQPPKGEQKGGKGGDFKSGKGGPGGFGGGFGARMGAPGQIMPAFLQDMLKMTDEQKKQLADLQKEVDGKMDKILTDDQKKQLKELTERGPGGKGGKGGKGDPPIKKDPPPM